MEVSQGIESNKKVSRAGSMIADLISQQQAITKGEIDAIMKLGEATLQPYNRSKGSIYVTAITISTDASPQAKELWSRKLANGTASIGAAKNSSVTVPVKLLVAGSFLVRVESVLNYKPVVTWAAEDTPALGLAASFADIPMNEKYYLRPRISQTIPCSDC